MYRFLLIMLLAGILSVGLNTQSRAQTIDPALESAVAASDPNAMLHVIVALAPPTTNLKSLVLPTMTKEQRRVRVLSELKSRAAGSFPSLISQMQGLGAVNFKRLWIVRSVAADVPAGKVKAIAGLPGVDIVRLDSTVTAPRPQSALTVTPEWNIAAIHAPDLWALGFRGQGVVVASLDTGVDVYHPDLAPRWRGGSNSWFDPYGETTVPFDPIGHGTQVMGLMVGGDAGGTAIGVAPDAQWISAKVFDNKGTALLSNVHLGFQWALDPDGDAATADAPDIVNASFSFPIPNDCNTEFQPDILALKTAGIAVVAAAGNLGPSGASSASPGNYPETFAVGAVDAGNSIGDFSSRGPSSCDGTLFPEVSAPGVGVETADLSFGGFPFYVTVNGTSAAAPHATGAMALLLSALPNLKPEEMEVGLEQSALDIGPVGPDNDTGHGLLDVLEAYHLLRGSGPVDADGDSYVAGIDCNDNDASIYPGAVETKFDGIDQDCNGYDLTIKIIRATYWGWPRVLTVEATSRLGKKANLVLVGYGPMKWSPSRRVWYRIVARVRQDPGIVTVSGIEGTETAKTAMAVSQR